MRQNLPIIGIIFIFLICLGVGINLEQKQRDTTAVEMAKLGYVQCQSGIGPILWKKSCKDSE